MGGHSIGRSKQEMCAYVCSIPNSFQDRATSLHSSLNLVPNIVLSHHIAPLPQACELVHMPFPRYLPSSQQHTHAHAERKSSVNY
jgi:hypothetical protein